MFLAVFFSLLIASLPVQAAQPNVAEGCARRLITTPEFNREMAALMKDTLLHRISNFKASIEIAFVTSHDPGLYPILKSVTDLQNNFERLRLETLPEDIASTSAYVQDTLRTLQASAMKYTPQPTLSNPE